MEIITINPQNPDPKVIKKASSILKKGGVIIYPTETAYGLGADATNKKAIEKIYLIKGRTFKKELPIIVSSLKMAQSLCNISSLALVLAEKFWPGPLTLVLKKKKNTNLAVGKKTVGLRIPSSDTALRLVEELGRPITSTSANLSTRPPCYSLAEIRHQIGDNKLVTLILSSGRLSKRPVSTIIDLSGKGSKILREGPIKEEELREFLCP